jgi:hypothetical protein
LKKARVDRRLQGYGRPLPQAISRAQGKPNKLHPGAPMPTISNFIF